VAIDDLLPRHLRLLGIFVAKGAPNKLLAEMLGTTTQVVKNNMREIYDHTGLDNRAELMRLVLSNHVLYERAQSAAAMAIIKERKSK
jgi:DNA-binding NarL/FixJ family response regulator